MKTCQDCGTRLRAGTSRKRCPACAYQTVLTRWRQRDAARRARRGETTRRDGEDLPAAEIEARYEAALRACRWRWTVDPWQQRGDR